MPRKGSRVTVCQWTQGRSSAPEKEAQAPTSPRASSPEEDLPTLPRRYRGGEGKPPSPAAPNQKHPQWLVCLCLHTHGHPCPAMDPHTPRRHTTDVQETASTQLHLHTNRTGLLWLPGQRPQHIPDHTAFPGQGSRLCPSCSKPTQNQGESPQHEPQTRLQTFPAAKAVTEGRSMGL